PAAPGAGGNRARPLPSPQDHLGEALANLPVGIEPGEPQILERGRPQDPLDLRCRLGRRGPARADFFEQTFEIHASHLCDARLLWALWAGMALSPLKSVARAI